MHSSQKQPRHFQYETQIPEEAHPTSNASQNPLKVLMIASKNLHQHMANLVLSDQKTVTHEQETEEGSVAASLAVKPVFEPFDPVDLAEFVDLAGPVAAVLYHGSG